MQDETVSSGMRANRATIVDVARLAGVSTATAGRALGGYGQVGKKSAASVRAAAQELGYHSNEVARSMRSGRTSTIGLVIADISGSFFEQTTLAIVRTAAQRGYHTLVLNTDEDLTAEADAVRVLLDKRVDGLIVVTSSRTGHDHLVNGGDLVAPLVFLDRRTEDVPACVVSTEDRETAREAAKLFSELGHTRIGMLTTTSKLGGKLLPYDSKQAVSTMHDRVSGLLEGIADAGLQLADNHLVYTDPDHNEAKTNAIRLLSGEERPTAVLAANAETALAIMDACNELGLEVGTDVSIVAFDDPSWARLLTPSLSVVARPVYDLGAAAVEKLIVQMRGEHDRPDSLTLPATIILRDSVGPPRT
ncbi:LacI family transcriptional regulator [Microbacterium ginsengiterrae]|uniref:LacI family transcriptional regulator n=1 Tax=Microbacterium ginsengiterrae TaxID=546115 RepID=A0A7W9FC94_9MICO|nr:LacI family DNA-binding transcriptional regulator [Microbacterium ginsengiterrae]MBB5741959.1 LacI family transcriptional regulator [Microbacterium ginsengiterrae]